MAVNTTTMVNTYTTMVDAVVARYTSMWNSNQIDAETYAKLVGEASSQFMQLAAELVQKQEQLDVQNQLTAQQVLNEAKQLELITKQVEIAGQELLLKQKQVDVTEREMVEKELTGAVQRVILATEEQAKQFEVDNILPLQKADAEKSVELKEQQRKVAYTEQVIKDKEAARLGLDNVVKQAETARATLDTYVYTPRYEE